MDASHRDITAAVETKSIEQNFTAAILIDNADADTENV
jgi:hypothetical protein